MKKTLLAAALIVGFAGVAQAETSVTLYGILDTGYGYNNFKYDRNDVRGTSTTSGMVGGIVNGSRWGMRGSEDLGNGLRAIFTLEAGIDVGTGNSSSGKMFHRQSFIGLSSDAWGTVSMGRQYSPSVTTNVANMTLSMGDMDKAFGGIGFANRMDNSFKYATPDFAGFTAAVAYANSATAVNRYEAAGVDLHNGSDRTNWLSAGVKYANGPLGVGLSYDRRHDAGANNLLTEKAMTSWVLSTAYDFEVVKLALAYGQDRHGKTGWGPQGLTAISGLVAPMGGAWALDNDFKSSNYYVALSAPLGGGTAAIGWSRSSSNLDDADKWGDEAKTQNIYSVNYVYPLSKRTSVYAYGSYGTGLSYVDGLKGKEAGVGLNVKF